MDAKQLVVAKLLAMPDAEPLPTGEELQRFWMARLPVSAIRMLLSSKMARPLAPASRHTSGSGLTAPEGHYYDPPRNYGDEP